MVVRWMGLERALLALFVASGFAGLIYQAIWAHYLGLSLGHAAYAQTLVLAIFMGGMALGAWLVSRRGGRWRRLIFAYALVELAIGLAGIAFHPVFEAYTRLSQDVVYPALSAGSTVRAWQWMSAALLIAPQSILLGMTFPLMSAGYLRVAPQADGEILGGLYFTNSIGAAVGALFATFVLLPAVGMPGAVFTAGVVNLAVGVVAWRIARHVDGIALPATSPASPVESEPLPPPGAADDPVPAPGFFPTMLVAAAITGASSFVYEIGWVRLLNLSLGTTIHSFELMLAAFILGLAFGGLWIRRRSRAIDDAVAYAGHAQVWMGIAALLSIPVFSMSFRLVAALMAALPKTDEGYLLFSLGSGGIALLVMFPAAFFAGMTLPLFTMALLRRGAGEASIGRIYAANTLGAIVGVGLTVHVLIPFLGLRLAIALAAVCDIALGLVLLRMYTRRATTQRFATLSVVSAIVLVGTLAFAQLDPRALASGVFRYGNASIHDDAEVYLLRDGKTATIALLNRESIGIIATNGKPDASIEMDPNQPPTPDEITMAMLAAVPLGVHPAPADIAVIGWGSGLTTHMLLGSRLPTKVDSIEIEAAMYETARNFGTRVARAYEDPRSHIHIDDARTYFSAGHRRYDVIVSEPSNPWVSGVASLFTQEFYRFLRGHLNEGGIVVQWLHSYELDDPLLATMMAAFVAEFDYVDAYTTNGADLVFVLSSRPIPPLDYERFRGDPIHADLVRVGLLGPGDFDVRRIGNRATLEALVAIYGAVPHSDFHPVVSLQAPRTRFRELNVMSFLELTRPGLPVLEMTSGRPTPVAAAVGMQFDNMSVRDHWVAKYVGEQLAGGDGAALERLDPVSAQHARRLAELSRATVGPGELDEWLQVAAAVADVSLGELTPAELQGLWIAPTWIDPAAQPAPVQAVLAAYAATAARDPQAMHRSGLAALAVVDPKTAGTVGEQMLTIAVLGAAASGEHAAAVAIEREHGGRMRRGIYGFARIYLQAWMDRGERGQ